ncbi:MAG: hypothetical protein AB7F43_04595 [Bacteriovoracia bacterium]
MQGIRGLVFLISCFIFIVEFGARGDLSRWGVPHEVTQVLEQRYCPKYLMVSNAELNKLQGNVYSAVALFEGKKYSTRKKGRLVLFRKRHIPDPDKVIPSNPAFVYAIQRGFGRNLGFDFFGDIDPIFKKEGDPEFIYGILPDPNEFLFRYKSAQKAFNFRIGFYVDRIVTTIRYLRIFAKNLKIPLARHGQHFYHDLTHHSGAVFLGPEALEHIQRIIRVTLETYFFLLEEFPHLADLLDAQMEKTAEELDKGLGNYGYYLSRYLRLPTLEYTALLNHVREALWGGVSAREFVLNRFVPIMGTEKEKNSLQGFVDQHAADLNWFYSFREVHGNSFPKQIVVRSEGLVESLDLAFDTIDGE